ncbi:related to Effector family protein Eff1 [Sporisorium scitamineum]|nr:related to Effector family protein Eff1 [Sporisorium scitamineum]
MQASRRPTLNGVAQALRGVNTRNPVKVDTIKGIMGFPLQNNPQSTSKNSLPVVHPMSSSSAPRNVRDEGPISIHSNDGDARDHRTILIYPIPPIDRVDRSLEYGSDTESDAASPESSLARSRVSGHPSQRNSYVQKHPTATFPRLEPSRLYSLEYSRPPFQRERSSHIKWVTEDDGDIRSRINEQIFANKLRWVSTEFMKDKTRKRYRGAALQDSRVLPMTDFPEIKLDRNRGVIKEVRMAAYGGSIHWPKNHPLSQAYSVLSFWGIPEGRGPMARKTVHYYGTGYVVPEDFDAVNEQVKKAKEEIERRARDAARVH